MKENWSYPVNVPFNHGEYRDLFNRYRSRLHQVYAKADLTGVLEASEDVPVLLRDIYVPLRVADKELDKSFTSDQVEKVKGISIEAVLCQIRYLAISGAPGSGKSMLTQFLAGAVSDDYINPTSKSLGRRLVIPFILREFDFAKIDSFEDLWQEWLVLTTARLTLEPGELNRAFFDFYIEKGWAIVIFDGIDELGEETNLTLNEWLNHWVEELNQNPEPASPLSVIITGRPYGYLPRGNYEKHFKKMYLQPFNRKEIQQYVNNWFGIRYSHDRVEMGKRVDNFLKALREYGGLEELKHRPIYLAMLAFVSETYGELPRTRTVAYTRMVDAYIYQLELLKRFKEKKGLVEVKGWSHEDRLKVMEELAYRVHTRACEKLESYSDKSHLHIFLEKAVFLAHIREILQTGRFDTIKPGDADKLAGFFLARTGLLVEPQEGYVQFSHLTFQEFLTAGHIYRRQKKLNPVKYLKKEIFDRLSGSGWHEVALLYFGVETLKAGEEQNEIFMALIDPGNENHAWFLIDLFATTDHTLTPPEVTRWLKTLVACWIYQPAPLEMYRYFQRMIREKMPGDIHQEMVEFLQKTADNCIESKVTLAAGEGITFTNEEARKFNEFMSTPFEGKGAENIFIIGFCWQEFRVSYFDPGRINRLSTLAFPPTVLLFILDSYLPFIDDGIKPALAQWVSSHIVISQLCNQWGISLFWTPYHTTDQAVRTVLMVMLSAYRGLLFSIQPLDEKGVGFLSKSREIAREIDREMTRASDMAWDLAKEMDWAIEKDKDINMAKVRKIARDMKMDWEMIRDMDLSWKMDWEMGRNIDLAGEIDWENAREMNWEMAKAREIAREIYREMDRARETCCDMVVAFQKNMDSFLSSKKLYKADIDNFSVLSWNAWVFLFYMYSSKLIDKLGLSVPVTKKEYEDLYENLKINEGAVRYFEILGCQLDDRRKEEIGQWMDEPASPRKLLAFILKNTTYQEFDVENTLADLRQFNEAFKEKYEKKVKEGE